MRSWSMSGCEVTAITPKTVLCKVVLVKAPVELGAGGRSRPRHSQKGAIRTRSSTVLDAAGLVSDDSAVVAAIRQVRIDERAQTTEPVGHHFSEGSCG